MKRTFFLSVVPILLLAGCITVPPIPTDVGVGKYLQFRTGSGLLVSQYSYRSAVDCDINIRGHWVSNFRSGFTTRCSETDLSYQLPYGLQVTKGVAASEANALFFYSSEACEKSADFATKENVAVAKFCSVPFEIGKIVNKKLVAEDADKLEFIGKAPEAGKSSSVEVQLKELKIFFDKGLISKDVYENRQKQILENMK